jgi:hypothetical protein
MAPNKRGGPPSSSVLSEEEVAARGRGTAEAEGTDSYDGSPAAELRVFFSGACRARAQAGKGPLPASAREAPTNEHPASTTPPPGPPARPHVPHPPARAG